MGGRRGKARASFAAVGAMTVSISIGVIGQPAVEAAPGDDAFDVPGLVALNAGGDAAVDVVSCSSAGNCSAGGYYRDSNGDYLAFLISQVDGVGSEATPVPGLAALDVGKDSEVDGLSCAADGECSAGGYYLDGNGDRQVFVLSQVDGVWGDASPIASLEALNTKGDADVADVSCAAPGYCVAAGEYESFVGDHAYVVTQVDGEWGTAIDVPGLPALDEGDNSDVGAVSCASRGHCSVAGYYREGDDDYQVFVASLVDGVWGSAVQLPGLDTLNTGGDAEVYSISCAAPGECTAVGYYSEVSGHDQGLVASQVDGVWEAATPVPGLEALNVGGDAIVNSVSCSAPGYCSAGGYYSDADGDQGFVVTQTGGIWGTATPVPGLKALNTNDGADVEVVECVSPGNCVAGGYYEDVDLGYFGFSTTQTDGTWSDAIRIPGLPTLAADNDAEMHAISCGSDGTCLGGGYYTSATDPDYVDQAYLFEFPIVPGGTLQPVPPARLVESRVGEETDDGESEGFGRVAAGSSTRFVVAGRGGVPEGADAAMLNVTAVFPDADGFLTVWSCEGDVPLASSVNYFAGGVFPNAVLTELNDAGEACVYSLAATDLIVDVNAYTD